MARSCLAEDLPRSVRFQPSRIFQEIPQSLSPLHPARRETKITN